MFKVYAGAAIPRQQKLMDDAAKAVAPIPNATILEENDRAASTQLHWMMLMICKQPGLNSVFLAGDSEGLEVATTDREVRAEDENTVCRAADVRPVLLIPR